jgi:hypothetical protein
MQTGTNTLERTSSGWMSQKCSWAADGSPHELLQQ